MWDWKCALVCTCVWSDPDGWTFWWSLCLKHGCQSELGQTAADGQREAGDWESYSRSVPPPRGKWRAEERKRDFKVWGKRKEEGFSVSPLKLNVCSGYLERFTISSTHGYSTHLPLLSCPAVYSVQLDTAAQDNRGGTTELKSVVKLSEVAAGQLIGNFERVFRIVFYTFLNASKLTCFQ